MSIKPIYKYLINLLFPIFLLAQNQSSISYLPIEYFYFNEPDLFAYTKYADKNVLSTAIEYKLLYSEKRVGKIIHDLYFWRQENQLDTQIDIANFKLNMSFLTSVENKYLKYSSSKNGVIKINTYNFLSFAQFSFPVRSYLDLNFGIGLRYIEESNAPVKFGFTLKPFNSIHFNYAKLFDYSRMDTDFIYSGDRESLTINSKMDKDFINLTVNLWKRLQFKATAVLTDFKTPKISDKSMLPLSGEIVNSNLHLNFDVLKNINVFFDYEIQQGDFSGRFYYKKQVFGSLNQVDYFRNFVTAGLKVRNISLSFGSGHGDAKISGYIESWPFTPVWADLLGLRSNAKTYFEYSDKLLSLKYINSFSQIDYHVALGWQQIKPDAELRTWEPLFLVFGQQNLQINDLRIKSHDGLDLSLRLSKTFFEVLKTNYTFTQYIPIYTIYQKKNVSGGSTGSKDEKSVYGGGHHTLRVSYYF